MKNPFLRLEIKNKKGEVYFRRYGIKTPWFGIYLHYIYKADEEKHMHDHPWDYVSIMLKGSYCEQMPKTIDKPWEFENIFPGEIHRNKAEHTHRLAKLCVNNIPSYEYTPPVITLFLTGRERRMWGYTLEDGTWVDHMTYRQMKKEGKFDDFQGTIVKNVNVQ